jgi:uncharacterized tellurite resistance protein B-like protein
MKATKNEYTTWTPVHDLALIYLALTHGADDALEASEVDAMAAKLRGWSTDLNIERIKKVMNDVMLVYMGGAGDQMLETAIASVGETMSKPRRIAVLNDLADIASADGMIVMGEVNFIQQLARDWDVENDIT